jgi:hypothetical protein
MHIRPDQPHTRPARRRKPLLAATAAALGIAAGLVSAAPAGAVTAAPPPASDSGTVTANVVVNSAIILTLLNTSFTLTGVPTDQPELTDAVDYEVFTNNTSGYDVTVQPASASLVATVGSNTDTIPVADLSVREPDGADTFLPLDAANPVQIYTQSTRSVESPGDTHSNDYEFNTPIPDVKDGTYTDDITYVATVNV